MNDEFKKLRQGFEAEGKIAARQASRRAAIDAAMAAFEEKNSESHQGTRLADRLIQAAIAVRTYIFRRRSMQLTHILAGGASLAAVGLVVANLDEFKSSGPLEETPPTRISETKTDLIRKPQPVTDGVARQIEQPSTTVLDIEIAPVSEALVAPVAPMAPAVTGLAFDQSASGIVAAPAPGMISAAQPQRAKSRALAKRVSPRRFVSSPREPRQVVIERQIGRDKFSVINDNPVKVASENPVSTFSIDVDTASYSFMRAALNRGVLPAKDAVRVEEMINYFPYDYAGPSEAKTPFKVSTTVMPTPWNAKTSLIHIGIKGYKILAADKPRANLVFLLDTSGSMNAPGKLPLLRNSFKLLLGALDPQDTVAIVAYAGSAGTVLEPTKVKDKNKILAALDRLHAGGSTAGGEGIRQAYQLAKQNFAKAGVNRVILATDGDFNVGISSPAELKSFVARQRKTGISLSVLGFGAGNYNDALMQTLAQNGNGNAAYIDTLSEARKVLVEEAGSTLFTIAKDVKIQVEFNPQIVSEYRLIGYETRKLAREDFNNDKVDAGDIGAGRTVTALYEVTPRDSAARLVDDLRYGKKPAAATGNTGEYAFLKMRYKLPDQSTSTLVSTPIDTSQTVATLAKAPRDARFAAAVAAYGQLLRGGRYTGTYSYDDVIALAQGAKGDDPFGYRAEFINLVRLAKSAAALAPQPR
ncbi:MAG: YfbK domain-containing protein [Alphaproteobacteria bacterium]